MVSSREIFAETLIGGLSTEEFPETHGGEMLKLVKDAAGVTEYLLPPLPNTLYTRDTTVLDLRRRLDQLAILAARATRSRSSPLRSTSSIPTSPARCNVWWGDPTADHGLATVEGGDVMPIGKGIVLIGMSERTSRQGISQLAQALFKQGAAERVIVAAMPKLRAAMHLDTVFTFADRDCVLLYPGHRLQHPAPIHTARPTRQAASSCARTPSRSSRPWPRRSGVKKMRVVETGGTAYMRERTQWDSGANLVCASPGVVFAYDRNTYTELRCCAGQASR